MISNKIPKVEFDNPQLEPSSSSFLTPRTKEVAGMNDRFNSLARMLSSVDDAEDDEVDESAILEDLLPRPIIKNDISQDSDDKNDIESDMEIIDDTSVINLEFWNSLSVPKPPSPSMSPSLILEDALISTAASTNVGSGTAYDEEFLKESANLSLSVSKVPKEVLIEQQKRIDEESISTRQKNIEIMKRRDTDILWREHLARERILQKEAQTKIQNEYDLKKLHQEANEREEFLNRQFRKAKEDLEEFVKTQQAQLVEVHGKLEEGNEVNG